MAPAQLPVLIIDGNRFDELDGFARKFSTLLKDHTWHGNLDAFNDILRGGFGTLEGGSCCDGLTRHDHSRHSEQRCLARSSTSSWITVAAELNPRSGCTWNSTSYSSRHAMHAGDKRLSRKARVLAAIR
jgi:hypothetical protein